MNNRINNQEELTGEIKPMSTGKKIFLGCLFSLIIFIVFAYFAIVWTKNKVVSFVAGEGKVAVIEELKKSYLPEDQKEAFITVIDEVFSKIASGEISINFSGEFENKKAAVAIISQSIKNAVSKLSFDETQKSKLIEQIDRMGRAYAENKVTGEEMIKLFEKMAKGSAGTVATIWFVEVCYIYKSGLSPEEKIEFKNTLGRLARGMKDNPMFLADIEKVLEPYQTVDEKGKKQLKPTLTDVELRDILKQLNQLLTDKNVSAEPLKLDIGEEVKLILDEAKVAQ